MKAESGRMFVFTPGNAVSVTVLGKQVSGDLFVSIQGDVNIVPDVVSPSPVSHALSSVFTLFTFVWKFFRLACVLEEIVHFEKRDRLFDRAL